ncbi:Sodium channel protein 60E [Portunus trituberculatus]|uniref:Sodium channel protein 60E n=1 Tax=Portunus trituberculatus TaxID=210409 RepID=A0A5B7CMS5_PORTR|nr:Sodium channel protein 60E [Portunus trituberculatus]
MSQRESYETLPKCPEGYSCLPDVGDNPNFGFTNFDNFLWSMLTTFQLITLDFWEDVYNKVIATGGPLQVVFFAIVVFFGSFYLINLMLAVVAMSYEEEAENTEEEKTKDLMDHRDDSTFSFDPEKLTHARPLEKKKPKNRRVIVMRRGAGILSDKFSKKKKKKDEEEGEDKRKGSASSEGTTSRQPSAPSNTPRLGSSQLDMSAGHHSLSRPASLVTTPLPSSSPAPTQPLHTPPSGRCQSSQGASVEGVPARTGASSSCDPCNASSTASCCTCHCHTRQQQVAVAPPGLVALRGGCDDPRPHLRLANNPAHRQPSLDDSGVVGDHEGGDSISIHHLPHAPQDNIFRRKKRKTEELDENDTAKDEEDAMPDRGVKKAFSEPEMHARCEEEAGGDPQMKGYKRMTVVESEGEGGNNEDSVSEVNLSDGNIPKMKLEEGGDAIVDKVVSVGSDRRPCVGSNPTTYRFEAVPFVKWFKVTYMSP